MAVTVTMESTGKYLVIDASEKLRGKTTSDGSPS